MDAEIPSKKRPYRVLSLDGGGMRGLYTTAVLHTLASRFHSPGSKLDIGAAFDLIAGTSTGGILAVALAAGLPTDNIIDFYKEDGPKIFKSPIPNGPIQLIVWAIQNFIKSANSNEVLEECLKHRIPDETIEQLYKRRKIALCIPAVDARTHKAWVFKTPHLHGKTRDNKNTLVEVCLSTSAAPMIFPIAAPSNPDIPGTSHSLVDGGLWANNPSLVGLIDALECADPDQNIEIISVGTCPPSAGQVLSKATADVGVLFWRFGSRALEMSIDAQSFGYSFVANQLARHISSTGRSCQIVRIPETKPSPEQAKYVGMDKASKESIDILIALGVSDGNIAHGNALKRADPHSQVIQNIFSSLRTISPNSVS